MPMKIIQFSILSLLSFSALAQITQQAFGSEHLLYGNSIATEGGFSSLNNPAAFNRKKELSLALSSSKISAINEIKKDECYLNYSNRKKNIGFGYTQSGSSFFKYARYNVSCGIAINEEIQIGIRTGIINTTIEGYPSSTRLDYSLGLLYKYRDKYNLAYVVSNAETDGINQSKPLSQAALIYKLTKLVSLSVKQEVKSGEKSLIGAGILIAYHSNFKVGISVSNTDDYLKFAMRYSKQRLILTSGACMNQYLGIKYSLSFQYSLIQP